MRQFHATHWWIELSFTVELSSHLELWTQLQENVRMYTFHALISFLSRAWTTVPTSPKDQSAFNPSRLHKVVLRQIVECNEGNWIHPVLMQCEHQHHPAPDHRHPGLFSPHSIPPSAPQCTPQYPPVYPPCPPPSSPPDTLTQGNFQTSPQSGKGGVFVRISFSDIFLTSSHPTNRGTWVDTRWRTVKQNWSWSTNICWVSCSSSLLNLGRLL